MIFTITLFRPLRMLLIEPIVAFVTLYVSFVFGVMFASFDTYPYVFQNARCHRQNTLHKGEGDGTARKAATPRRAALSFYARLYWHSISLFW